MDIQIDTSKLEAEEVAVAKLCFTQDTMEIGNKIEYGDTVKWLQDVKVKIKELDTLRKSITKPIAKEIRPRPPKK